MWWKGRPDVYLRAKLTEAVVWHHWIKPYAPGVSDSGRGRLWQKRGVAWEMSQHPGQRPPQVIRGSSRQKSGPASPQPSLSYRPSGPWSLHSWPFRSCDLLRPGPAPPLRAGLPEDSRRPPAGPCPLLSPPWWLRAVFSLWQGLRHPPPGCRGLSPRGCLGSPTQTISQPLAGGAGWEVSVFWALVILTGSNLWNLLLERGCDILRIYYRRVTVFSNQPFSTFSAGINREIRVPYETLASRRFLFVQSIN